MSEQQQAPPPANQLRVFYRSANDGWRVGQIAEFTNASVVRVADAVTGLEEPVRPTDVINLQDVVKPKKQTAKKSSARSNSPFRGGSSRKSASSAAKSERSATVDGNSPSAAEAASNADDNDDDQHQHHQPPAIDNAHPLLHMMDPPSPDQHHHHHSNKNQYVALDDITAMDPSPVEVGPAIIDCLRQRHHDARLEHAAKRAAAPSPSSSAASATSAVEGRATNSSSPSSDEPIAPMTLFAGDNVEYVFRAAPSNGVIPAHNKKPIQRREEATHATSWTLAERAVAALEATGKPQTVIGASAASPYAEITETMASSLVHLGASGDAIAKAKAAVCVLQAFTHDIHGAAHAAVTFQVMGKKVAVDAEGGVRGGAASGASTPAAEGSSDGESSPARAQGEAPQTAARHQFRALKIDTGLVDYDRLVTSPTGNYEAFGFLLHAFSDEEKERCYISRKKIDFAAFAGSIGEDRATVDRIRERYFMFCEAMETMGFEIQVQLFVLSRVAVALHLLEIDFEGGSVKNLASMRSAARILGMDFSTLQQQLTTKRQCQTMAKYVFSAIVRYVVSRLNGCLNPRGVEEGDAVGTVLTLVSGFAPTDKGVQHEFGGLATNPASVHDLFRNLLYEDIVQSFYRSSESDMALWQQQGFVVPADTQASFDAFDNYPVVRLAKAKGGVISTITFALAQLMSKLNPPSSQAQAGDNNDNNNDDGANGPQPQQQTPPPPPPPPPEDPNVYFGPEPDVVEMMSNNGLPRNNKKKAPPAMKVPGRYDNLALMAFFFATTARIGQTVGQSINLSPNGEHLFTMAPSGTGNFWSGQNPKDEKASAFTFNVSSDVESINIKPNGLVLFSVRPQGAKSAFTQLEVNIGLEVGNNPDALVQLENALCRALFFYNPKIRIDWTAKPRKSPPRDSQSNLAASASATQQPPASPPNANVNQEAELVRVAFARLGRHSGVEYDPDQHTLTLTHCFGDRVYALPPLPPAEAIADGDGALEKQEAFFQSHPSAAQFFTPRARIYDDVRDFFLGNSDVETQEALYMEEQAEGPQSTVAAFQGDLDAITLETLAQKQPIYWYCFVGALAKHGTFRGDLIERQLHQFLYPQIRRLRQTLPRRYLPAAYPHIVRNFLPVLNAERRRAFHVAAIANKKGPHFNRIFAEEICIAAGVPHISGANHLLIEGRGLLILRRAVLRREAEAVGTVQTFLRWRWAESVVTRRLTSIVDALAKDEEERAAVVAQRQWHIDHTHQHRIKRIEIQDEEFTTRRAVMEDAWVEWVAIQTAMQNEIEAAVQSHVTNVIKEQQRSIARQAKKARRAAVDDVAKRIQEQLISQGAGMDDIVRKKLVANAAAKERMQRLQAAHDKLLNMKVAREEERSMLEHSLQGKATRIERVKREREMKRAALREELFQKQERERIVRSQIESVQDQMTQQLAERAALEDVQAKLSGRIKHEVDERQRKQREAIRQQHLRERQQKEEQLRKQAKAQWRSTVKHEKEILSKKEREERAKKQREIALWHAQEKERQQMERTKHVESERQKTLTRNLLRAHTMLCTPTVFEQAGGGAKSSANGASAARMRSYSQLSGRRRGKSVGSETNSQGPPLLDGFVMEKGHKTYPPILPESVWDGIIRHHQDVIDEEMNNPNLNNDDSDEEDLELAVRVAQQKARDRRHGVGRPKSRLRSASPRSVLSL